MPTAVFILVRILSNPFSNLFQKKLVSKNNNSLLIIFITFSLLSAASIPLFSKVFFSGLPADYFLYMVLCAVFAVSSNAFLVRALSYSDLSLLGPVNSYKPVVGMILGVFMLNEIPSLLGLMGVGLILSGSYFIVDKNTGQKNTGFRFVNDKGIQFRIAALFLSGVEAVFLKKALTYSTPLVTMGLWCFSGFIISGTASIFVFKFNILNKLCGAWNEKKNYFLLFATTAAMQYTTLLIFENMQVSYALALFQTSALISVLLGYKYFNEKNIGRRIVGSLLMVTGSVFIILYN